MTEKLTWDKLTIDGVPSTSLSEVNQKIFQSIFSLEEECAELSVQFNQKRAAIQELSKLIDEEVKSLKQT